MNNNILDDIMENFNITEDIKIEFNEIYGFTFVFETKIILINDEISSGEIKPLGIIYRQNKDYYFTPLDEKTNIKEIVKKYLTEEEYFHF